MTTVMKARLIKIGNSQGIRIPKVLLDQLDFGEEVELEVQSNQLVLRPAQRPRHGWAAQFRLMADQGDDTLLDAEETPLSTWDADEWSW